MLHPLFSTPPPRSISSALQPFYDAMYRALKPGGVVCTQAESQWYHLDIIKSLAAMCHSVFQGGSVQYGFTTIPTYPRCVQCTPCRAACSTACSTSLQHKCSRCRQYELVDRVGLGPSLG